MCCLLHGKLPPLLLLEFSFLAGTPVRGWLACLVLWLLSGCPYRDEHRIALDDFQPVVGAAKTASTWSERYLLTTVAVGAYHQHRAHVDAVGERQHGIADGNRGGQYINDLAALYDQPGALAINLTIHMQRGDPLAGNRVFADRHDGNSMREADADNFGHAAHVDKLRRQPGLVQRNVELVGKVARFCRRKFQLQVAALPGAECDTGAIVGADHERGCEPVALPNRCNGLIARAKIADRHRGGAKLPRPREGKVNAVWRDLNESLHRLGVANNVDGNARVIFIIRGYVETVGEDAQGIRGKRSRQRRSGWVRWSGCHSRWTN